MPYKVRLSHINKDFTFDPYPEGYWSDQVPDDSGLIFLMNRVAVAASQHATVEFPEIEINKEGRRVTVTAVNGQLIYNDTHTAHCQNLKVIPDEVIRLLEDKPLDQVFVGRGDEDSGAKLGSYRKARYSLAFQIIIFAMMLGSLFWAGVVYHNEFVVNQSLTEPLEFEAEPDLEDINTSKTFSGVYYNEIRDGGTVFRISSNGIFEYYEMWYSKQTGLYELHRRLHLPFIVGKHNGELAFLAGEVHLLMPVSDDTIALHNDVYQRSQGPLETFGNVVKK
ncbi:MAG TPA: hypothetical protein DCX06_01890 [Opitutae bacterium]|nr:hypothetical protein [Opitutae bacterium]